MKDNFNISFRSSLILLIFGLCSLLTLFDFLSIFARTTNTKHIVKMPGSDMHAALSYLSAGKLMKGLGMKLTIKTDNNEEHVCDQLITDGTLDGVLQYPNGNWCLVKTKCKLLKKSATRGSTYEI